LDLERIKMIRILILMYIDFQTYVIENKGRKTIIWIKKYISLYPLNFKQNKTF